MDYNMNKKVKKSGIYKITNIKNDKVYIGQSVNLKTRIYEHKLALNKNNHHNTLLQKSFNKHGKKNFVIEILEECDVDELDNKEIFWISLFDSTNRNCGYNLESGGNANKVIHKETRLKLSEALKGTRLGAENPMFGKKLSKERKEQMRLINQGSSDKLTEEDVKYIKMALYLGIAQRELTDMYTVKPSTISKIAKGINWYWVLEHLNEEISNSYDKEKKKRKERILELYNQGKTNVEISDRLGCSYHTVCDILNGRLKQDTETRYELIREDHNNGMKRKEIMIKYNIAQSVYDRAVGDLVKKDRSDTYLKVLKMKEEGMSNQSIADQLGIHRTTVTEYLKGRTTGVIKERVTLTDELRKQIIELYKQGDSQRNISRVLSVSRGSVRKVIEGA